MKKITIISESEIDSIKFAIDRINDIREHINSENQDNRIKSELVMSLIDIEEVLSMVSDKLEEVII